MLSAVLRVLSVVVLPIRRLYIMVKFTARWVTIADVIMISALLDGASENLKHRQPDVH